VYEALSYEYLADDGEFARVVVADVTVHGELHRPRYVSALLRYTSSHALKKKQS